MWQWFRGGVLFVVFLILALQAPSRAAEILLDDYKSGLSPKWREKCLAGKTSYEVIEEDGQPYIQATSSSAASALYYKIEYDAKEYPIITWSWKVANVLTKGNALEKEGHDFAARVMVIFPATVPWKSQALSYSWANRLPIGSVTPNPYAPTANTIALKSGSDQTGQWFEEKRNILEDYRRCFGQDPPQVGAIAIMTDTDNTCEEAMAWYGPIRISAASN
jgi:hypothetical protein